MPRRLRYNQSLFHKVNAEWSSPVARQAHNLKAAGSNPASATNTLLFVFKYLDSVVNPRQIARISTFFFRDTQRELQNLRRIGDCLCAGVE
jgi:hypothetical protein